jgi:aqualysin 1
VKPLSRRILATLAVTPVLLAGAGVSGAAAAGPTFVRPGVAADPAPSDGQAPLLGIGLPNLLANRYIVVLRDSASKSQVTSAEAAVKSAGGKIHLRYGSALLGFTATLPDKALADLRDDPDVAYVEADREVSIAAMQSNATWGLDRVDQRSRNRNGIYVYNSTGNGVKAYVIDSGIRFSHNQFGGRAVFGYDTFGSDGSDCNGHGTHVAGTLGGSTYGVAKRVTLVSVRVLDCEGSGTLSGVIGGINWVSADHASGTPAVANVSLGGAPSTALDNAVTSSLRDGVTYAVAAGNDGGSACATSPARTKGAITVGATKSNDYRAGFSNYGSCLDLFAPGGSIRSAFPSSDSATALMSGTSMASPHVAGAAALYLQRHPSATPGTVRNAVVGAATTSTVIAAGSGSPNRLLYSRAF